MSPQATAKAIVKRWMDERGIKFSRLSSRKVDFSDLARGSALCVKIHGCQFLSENSGEAFNELAKVSKSNGFQVSATSAP